MILPRYWYLLAGSHAGGRREDLPDAAHGFLSSTAPRIHHDVMELPQTRQASPAKEVASRSKCKTRRSASSSRHVLAGRTVAIEGSCHARVARDVHAPSGPSQRGRQGAREVRVRGVGRSVVADSSRRSLAKQLADRHVDPEIAELSAGERLRRALIELGTTWIKFGQMLSLRPDVVGEDVAEELAKLQATVPGRSRPDSRSALVERELGGPVSELYGVVRAGAVRVGLGGPGAPGDARRTARAVAVKVLHDGVERKVLEDLELMQAIAAYLEDEDAEIAQLRPTLLIGEFSQMMHDAIDLSQELSNLQRFTANFAAEPDIVFPTPYPELSTATRAHDEHDLGRAVHRPRQRRGDGLGRREAGAPRRRRLPRDDLPRLAVPRRPAPRELPASRRRRTWRSSTSATSAGSRACGSASSRTW